MSGDRPKSPEDETLFSVRDAARLFGLKESRLRYWAQTGFINPSARKGGRGVYTYSDLIEIRAAHELLGKGIPLQRVRRNLQALRQALPGERSPLQRLRVQSDGDNLIVIDEGASFNPESGQMLLDFHVGEIRERVAEVLAFEDAAARRRAQPEPRAQLSASAAPAAGAEEPAEGAPETAYGWFLRGSAIDDDPARLQEAIAAYQRAVELDPSLAAAHTNLGNLYYRHEERAAAIRSYETACALDPDQAEARYNLANIYEEEGDFDLAIAEYRQALRCAPEFSDGHFNLALALERAGSRAQAISHWRRYLELTAEDAATDDAEWRELARGHLARLEQRSREE